jgi:hypothetical protein
VQLTPSQATAQFPPAEVANLRTITQDTLTKVQTGDQAGAAHRVTDLETAWDEDQSTLQSLNGTGWQFLDGQIDTVLTSLRAAHPHVDTEKAALTALVTSLS